MDNAASRAAVTTVVVLSTVAFVVLASMGLANFMGTGLAVALPIFLALAVHSAVADKVRRQRAGE